MSATWCVVAAVVVVLLHALGGPGGAASVRPSINASYGPGVPSANARTCCNGCEPVATVREMQMQMQTVECWGELGGGGVVLSFSLKPQ